MEWQILVAAVLGLVGAVSGAYAAYRWARVKGLVTTVSAQSDTIAAQREMIDLSRSKAEEAQQAAVALEERVGIIEKERAEEHRVVLRIVRAVAESDVCANAPDCERRVVPEAI